MSISDNEDVTDTTYKQRDAKSPPRKIRHRRHHDEDTTDKSDAGKPFATRNAVLEGEEVIRLTYERVEELLNGSFGEERREEENSIVVIPSLVSLSTEFFKPGNVDGGTEGATYAASGRSVDAPSAMNIEQSFSADLPSSFPTLDNSTPFTPSLRPRDTFSFASSDSQDAGTGNVADRVRNDSLSDPPRYKRSVTPPIGPQGAPIPSHILRAMNNNVGEGDGTAAGVARGGEVAEPSTFELNNTPASPNRQQVFSTNYNNVSVQLSAPGRLGGTTMGEGFQQGPQQQPARYINVIRSLEAAIKRLKTRLKEAEGEATSSRVRSRSIGSTGDAPLSPMSPREAPTQAMIHRDNIDELEKVTITKLADIMLHPPAMKVVRLNGGEVEEVVRYIYDNLYERGEQKASFGDRNSTLSDHASIDDTESGGIILEDKLSSDKQSGYPDSQSVHASVATLGLSIPRRVCQHPFRRNDIVWVCRTCQSDETCVLCHDCYTHSNHEGHDVAFYHAQADADAWDPKGFCSKHGQKRGNSAPPGSAVAVIEPSVLGGVHACADWLVEVVHNGVEEAYRRANPDLFGDIKRGKGEKKPAKLERSESISANCCREEGLETRQRMEVRRQQSLHRRNTVADVETMDLVRSDEEEKDEGKETELELQPGTPLSNVIVHEAQFDPAAASLSKKWSESSKDDSMNNPSSQLFDPEAAGSRVAKKAKPPPVEQSPARALGELGRKEQGLFLVLHADDIHTAAHQPTDVLDALKELFSSPGGGGRPEAAAFTSTEHAAGASPAGATFLPRPLGTAMALTGHRLAPRLGDARTNRFLFRAPQADASLNKIVRLIQKCGNLIVWGTQELLAECGDVVARCWLDGDPASSTWIGAAMLNRAKILTDRGLICSIKTYHDLKNDQKATAIIRLISSLAQSCDPLCDQVSSGISGRGISTTLNAIIRSDLKLPCKFTTSWHALLLTLLAQPEFKASLAVAYCDTYRAVMKEYATGVGVVERSSFTLSVQFLNRVTYVENLVRDRNLLSKLSKSLLETMSSASFIPGALGSPPPAGATPEMLLHSSSLHTESSNLAAILMALLGIFSTGRDDYVFLELDSEIDNIMNDLGEIVTGGDSRHHGRSAVTRAAKDEASQQDTQPTVASFLKRTAALVNPTLNPIHPFLLHRRYSPCISDLKCVLNVKGMSRIFLSLPSSTGDHSSFSSNDGIALDNWIKTLSLAQNMDGQMWRSWNMGHVESEPRGWVGAFNTSISLGSVFERLLNWEDSDPCIIGDNSLRLLSCAEVAHYTLTTGVHRWQRSEMLSYRSTPSPSFAHNVPPHALCPASLPFSTVASNYGSALACAALPLSQIQSWSFHLPLHRFAAACIREVSRRPGGGGISDLVSMFEVPEHDKTTKSGRTQLRLNALLFRGLMEFPVIVLARSAQIRAGLWRRNGPGMTDQVLNYSEPPFCKALQDSDILLVQFALICHGLRQRTSSILSNDSLNQPALIFGAHGTSRLVNLLLHRFGVFGFLGFKDAPSTDIRRYIQEIEAGLYPGEVKSPSSADSPTLPWIYSPAAKDPSASMNLVEELQSLIIILITEMPSPPARNKQEGAMEAKRRLRKEVIHRLASGPKTHSEMAEVHHVLPQRDNLVLCDEGKLINPDDASGAALESVLNEVAARKTRIGEADQWELRKWAWDEYDPSFHRIGTRAHQSATEHRPKQPPGKFAPYAPKPAVPHASFKRIRRDLTADSSVLAIVYRVIHCYCHKKDSKSMADLTGKEMYESAPKSETSLSRALHILTLGAFSWEETPPSVDSWKDLGGGDIGSVFYSDESSRGAPNASDWIDMALLRSPADVMRSRWYEGEENALLLLKRLASEAITSDVALMSGAAWLCDWAARCNLTAATLLGRGATGPDNQKDELEKRKALAKARQQQAMERMKAQMAKFAKTFEPEFTVQEDAVSEEGPIRSPPRVRSESAEQFTFTTPIRNRNSADSDDISVHAMDLGSPGEFILTTPPPSYPSTPRTPRSGSLTPKSTPQHTVSRLLGKRPQCIICADNDTLHVEKKDAAPVDDGALAFCAYAQPSTVAKGGGLPVNLGLPKNTMKRHVGVFINLCGHAVHSLCCESYLKTVREDRFIDRMEGGKHKEFRCPLCQRLSNCLVPFIDVAVDWIDSPVKYNTTQESDEAMADDKTYSTSLHDFLSSTKWWSSRNDNSMKWDGHCTFTAAKEDDKQRTSLSLLPQGFSTKKTKNIFGKRELMSAWNGLLKTPRFVHRRARGLTPDRSSSSDTSAFHSAETEKQTRVADVWRRFMDTVSDYALKADTKRLGEETLALDYGEFRHYLREKALYNKTDASHTELIDWPACLSSAPISESRRQELSKEKLIANLLFSIQSFTYTCCSESADARRLVVNSSDSTDSSSPLMQFGIGQIRFQGNLLLFPKANSSVDSGCQPFNGRLGKLRYLGLALMVASSPVSREIVQLCMSFPSQPITRDPFDFDEHMKETEKKRVPIAYPILCSHVLTHTTACLVAVTGRARTDDEGPCVDSLIDECRQFIQLGFIARTAQCLLAKLMPTRGTDVWRRSMQSTLQKMLSQKSTACNNAEDEWILSCLLILQALLGRAEEFGPIADSEKNEAKDIFQAIESAKLQALEFLREVSVIVQMLIPNIFAMSQVCVSSAEPKEDSTPTLQSFMILFRIESLTSIVRSSLLKEILASWFREATETSSNHVGSVKIFQEVTWPQAPSTCSNIEHSYTVLVPLLCGSDMLDPDSLCRISCLPRSYTDLYAELVSLCPDCEQIALCLICGEVLSASGKGSCSQHAFKCGGGAGIFFLLQECVGLLIHGSKAAYIHSPYVDSHGETPQYRGRPLNLDASRYEILSNLWSGHGVRERVIAERGTTRQVIIPGFY